MKRSRLSKKFRITAVFVDVPANNVVDAKVKIRKLIKSKKNLGFLFGGES